MDNYRMAVGIEPINDYDKAKQDVMQAIVSVCKLTPQQQRMLAEEFFGAANVAALQVQFKVPKWHFRTIIGRTGYCKCS